MRLRRAQAAPRSKKWAQLLHFNDGFDLNGDVQRQRVGADSRARMHAFLTENSAEQVTSTVHNLTRAHNTK